MLRLLFEKHFNSRINFKKALPENPKLFGRKRVFRIDFQLMMFYKIQYRYKILVYGTMVRVAVHRSGRICLISA